MVQFKMSQFDNLVKTRMQMMIGNFTDDNLWSIIFLLVKPLSRHLTCQCTNIFVFYPSYLTIYEIFSVLGEILSFENLVFSVFEFISALVETPKFKKKIDSSLEDILFFTMEYMQITDDQVKDVSIIILIFICKSFLDPQLRSSVGPLMLF